ITKLVGKAGYRNIKDILKYIIPTLIKNQIFDPLEPTIYIRISGDGRNVGPNSKYFCSWCTCQKSKIGLINKSWTIEKLMDSINQNIKSYLDCLWDLAIQEYKNDKIDLVRNISN
ncbi:31611_t:CDS:2, partial [Gigaspora margarita]